MATPSFVARVGGKFKQVFAVLTSAGPADAFKIPALDTSGKLDASLLPPQAPSALVSMTAAATTDIGAAGSNMISLEPGDTVTSLGAGPVGSLRVLLMQGATTFVHDPTKIILQDGTDMTSVAGSSATFYCVAVGVWQCLWWTYGPGAITRTAPYQQVMDLAAPATSKMALYGGAAAYSQPAALVYGSGSQLAYVQARPPTTTRRIWFPDADGDVFVLASGAEAPIPPLLMPPRVGRYYAGPYGGLTPTAVTAGVAYFNKIYLRQSTPMQKVGFTVTTAGAPGSTAQITLYRVNGNAITAQIAIVTVATDTTGDKFTTPVAPIPPGTYLIAVRFVDACSVNFQTLIGPTGNSTFNADTHGATTSTELSSPNTQLTYTGATLPLGPINLTSLVYGAGLTPHFWFQA